MMVVNNQLIRPCFLEGVGGMLALGGWYPWISMIVEHNQKRGNFWFAAT